MTDLLYCTLFSLRVSLSATILCALAGIPLGAFLRGNDSILKRTILSVFNTLLSIPTVIIGILGYSLLSRRSVLGSLGLLFTPAAIILGQFFLALPIMTVFSHSAISAVDGSAVETAYVLGAGRISRFLMLVSEARLGILAAVGAVFGRLIGEVGVATMLGGNIAGYTRTLTTSIALEASRGQLASGLKLGAVLLIISVAVNISMRYLQSKKS